MKLFLALEDGRYAYHNPSVAPEYRVIEAYQVSFRSQSVLVDIGSETLVFPVVEESRVQFDLMQYRPKVFWSNEPQDNLVTFPKLATPANIFEWVWVDSVSDLTPYLGYAVDVDYGVRAESLQFDRIQHGGRVHATCALDSTQVHGKTSFDDDSVRFYIRYSNLEDIEDKKLSYGQYWVVAN